MPYVIKLSNKISNEAILNSTWFIIACDILFIAVSYVLANTFLNDVQTRGCIPMKYGNECIPISISQWEYWVLKNELFVATGIVTIVLLPIQLFLRRYMVWGNKTKTSIKKVRSTRN